MMTLWGNAKIFTNKAIAIFLQYKYGTEGVLCYFLRSIVHDFELVSFELIMGEIPQQEKTPVLYSLVPGQESCVGACSMHCN